MRYFCGCLVPSGLVSIPPTCPLHPTRDAQGTPPTPQEPLPITYQLAWFDPTHEMWRWHRNDWPDHKIVDFPTFAEAEARALELSKLMDHREHEILILTLHASLKTQTVYPKKPPIQETKRIDLTNALGREIR